MQIETEGTFASDNASEEILIEAFNDDKARGSFIILSQSDQIFMQASGIGDGPYTLEYREGSDNKHFQCAEDLHKDIILDGFMKYLKGDESWRTDFAWKPLNEIENETFFDSEPQSPYKDKPWWKFW